MLRASTILAAVLVMTGAGRDATAELLSSRPITVVIPFTPGASSDTLQRIVNKKVAESSGQTLVVESRPGGGGVVAAAVVKQAPPDGHTLFQGNAGTHAANASLYATLPYDPIKDAGQRRLDAGKEQPGNQQADPDHEAEQADDVDGGEFADSLLPQLPEVGENADREECQDEKDHPETYWLRRWRPA